MVGLNPPVVSLQRAIWSLASKEIATVAVLPRDDAFGVGGKAWGAFTQAFLRMTPFCFYVRRVGLFLR